MYRTVEIPLINDVPIIPVHVAVHIRVSFPVFSVRQCLFVDIQTTAMAYVIGEKGVSWDPLYHLTPCR